MASLYRFRIGVKQGRLGVVSVPLFVERHVNDLLCAARHYLVEFCEY